MPKILGILTLLFWLVPAEARNFIDQASYLEDPSGQLSLDQLPQDQFESFSGLLGKGYSQSTFWVRLHLNPEGAKDFVLLRIRPNYLDKVILFDPAYHSLGQVMTGDETDSRDTYQSLNLTLTIPSGVGPRDIWLKIRTNSTFLFDAEALQLEDMIREDQFQQLKSAFYLSLIGLFIVWGALNWLATRDEVIAAFVLKQVSCLFYMAGILGYLRYFWPNPSVISSGLVVDLAMGIYGTAAFWFEYRFLREFNPNPYALRVLKWMSAFLPFYLLLAAVGKIQLAFMVMMLLFLVAPVFTFIMVFTIKSEENAQEITSIPLSRNVLIAVYGFILIVLSLTTFPILGWWQSGPMVFDRLLIYSLVNGLVILIALQLRMRNFERQRVALEAQNLEIRKQIDRERLVREEQGRFLDMLTHELRTPMAAISMSLGNSDCEPELLSEARQSISEMAAILDRCLTSDQIAGGQLSVTPTSFCVTDELESLISKCPEPSRIDYRSDRALFMTSDVVLFRLVMTNLIDNALKYSDKHSRVEIRLEADDSTQSIRVGNLPGKAGWPDASRLFEKYYRSPLAHSASGTGLGLYLSRQLAHALSGELHYTPTQAQIGFTLCLPL